MAAGKVVLNGNNKVVLLPTGKVPVFDAAGCAPGCASCPSPCENQVVCSAAGQGGTSVPGVCGLVLGASPCRAYPVPNPSLPSCTTLIQYSATVSGSMTYAAQDRLLRHYENPPNPSGQPPNPAGQFNNLWNGGASGSAASVGQLPQVFDTLSGFSCNTGVSGAGNNATGAVSGPGGGTTGWTRASSLRFKMYVEPAGYPGLNPLVPSPAPYGGAAHPYVVESGGSPLSGACWVVAFNVSQRGQASQFGEDAAVVEIGLDHLARAVGWRVRAPLNDDPSSLASNQTLTHFHATVGVTPSGLATAGDPCPHDFSFSLGLAIDVSVQKRTVQHVPVGPGVPQAFDLVSDSTKNYTINASLAVGVQVSGVNCPGEGSLCAGCGEGDGAEDD